MKKLLPFFIVIVLLISSVTFGKSDNKFSYSDFFICDTLPVTDTVGQGNWQHSLRNDTFGGIKDKIDSSTFKIKKDSSSKAPPDNK